MVWLLSVAWAGECIIPAYSTDLLDAVDDAEDTFRSLDIAAFLEATGRLEALLPCLADPVPRQVAAQVHRYLGIRAYGERNLQDAEVRLMAGRALEPEYTFPDALMPQGHPVREFYAALEVDESLYAFAPPPASGYLQFDGQTSNQRPTDWATVVQRFDGTGKIVETVYLLPGQPLPTYPVQVGAYPAVFPLPEPEPDPGGPPTSLLVATGVTALSTGILYGLAGHAHGQFQDPDTPDARLDGLAGRANALSVASAITGTATLGFGVGIVLRL